jgi:hypothetical protein
MNNKQNKDIYLYACTENEIDRQAWSRINNPVG